MEGLGARQQRHAPDELRGHMDLLERKGFQGDLPAHANRGADQATSQRAKQDAMHAEPCLHQNDDET